MSDHASGPQRQTPGASGRGHTGIAFQGQPGAYSHMACHAAFPEMEAVPCHSFEDAFAAVHEGRTRLAMIPVDNSVAGRVADVHHLLPHGGLFIIGEKFQRVNHHLLAVPGATLETVKTVESHIHALGQCRNFLRRHGYRPQVGADTAGAAAALATRGDPSRAAIASRLAAQIYGLDVLASDIEDAEHNTTRFLILAKEPLRPEPGAGLLMTTFIFTVRNVPAALYKAMGGFATNGVNMVKLESYIDGAFTQAAFLADIIGHPDEDSVRLAFEELRFFARGVEILGVYPADEFRQHVG
jgi:prephenate dehydratase